jgi:vancomycin aglycone glucosyltransferase
MRVLLSPYGSHGSHGSRESRGDVEPMLGLAVQLRALQARGAAMPVCAPPDFAHRLARVGVPLALVVPVGQPVRPLVTRVTATAEGCDALEADGMMLAMPAGGWL